MLGVMRKYRVFFGNWLADEVSKHFRTSWVADVVVFMHDCNLYFRGEMAEWTYAVDFEELI